MRRSAINAILADSHAFIRQHGWHLPPFGHWTPSDWATKGDEVSEIVERGLGWDVTDFGSGDFDHRGLVLFTLRNGRPEHLSTGRSKLYAEKLMIVEVGQVTPLHFHWMKTEDIIVRGGGSLVVQLSTVTPDEGLGDGDVTVRVDGVRRTIASGGYLVLGPGESVSVPDHVYHAFWADDGRVLAGEVSLVNDDRRDNRFLDAGGRFPAIDEDEAPLHYLTSDYASVPGRPA
jgi:D-lyxose ketol-isomerase